MNKDELIVGNKVFLRKMQEVDASFIVQWRNDIQIQKWMFNQTALSIDSHLEWFRTRKANRIDYVICDIKNEKPIGTLNFTNILQKTAEAGKLIGNKDYWGGGYAKEAFTLWLDFGFNKLGVESIYVQTMAHNIANIKLNEILGFIETERFKHNINNEQIEFIKMVKIKE